MFSFRQKLIFWITNFKIHPVESVHMDRTDHFVFLVENRRDMEKRYQKKNLEEKSVFEIIAKMN